MIQNLTMVGSFRYNIEYCQQNTACDAENSVTLNNFTVTLKNSHVDQKGHGAVCIVFWLTYL